MPSGQRSRRSGNRANDPRPPEFLSSRSDRVSAGPPTTLEPTSQLDYRYNPLGPANVVPGFSSQTPILPPAALPFRPYTPANTYPTTYNSSPYSLDSSSVQPPYGYPQAGSLTSYSTQGQQARFPPGYMGPTQDPFADGPNQFQPALDYHLQQQQLQQQQRQQQPSYAYSQQTVPPPQYLQQGYGQPSYNPQQAIPYTAPVAQTQSHYSAPHSAQPEQRTHRGKAVRTKTFCNVGLTYNTGMNPHDWVWICCECNEYTYEGDRCVTPTCPGRHENKGHRICFMIKGGKCAFRDISLDPDLESCIKDSYARDTAVSYSTIIKKVYLRRQYFADIERKNRRPLLARDVAAWRQMNEKDFQEYSKRFYL